MCTPKTMFKIGAILAAAFAVAWFAFPSVRATIVWAAPFAVFLICPLAMLFGMYGMRRMGHGEAKRHADCCGDHSESSAEKEKVT